MAGGNEALIRALSRQLAASPNSSFYGDSPTAQALVRPSVSDPFAYAHLQGARARDEEARQRYLNDASTARQGAQAQIDQILKAPAIAGYPASVQKLLMQQNPEIVRMLVDPEYADTLANNLEVRRRLDNLGDISSAQSDQVRAGGRPSESLDFNRLFEDSTGLLPFMQGPNSIDAAMAGTEKRAGFDPEQRQVVTTTEKTGARTPPQVFDPELEEYAARLINNKSIRTAQISADSQGRPAILVEFNSGGKRLMTKQQVLELLQ